MRRALVWPALLVLTVCDRRAVSGGGDSFRVEATGSRVAGVCYRSDNSVLLGPATASGQQGAGHGWIALQTPLDADSGWATLADSGSKTFTATWRRDADMIELSARDDFLRVDLRVAATDSVLMGGATAHSDAALERDSSGTLGDLRRRWTFRAVRVPCSTAGN